MKIIDFVQGFKDKKIMNTKVDTDAVGKYIKETLEVREYVPFKEKRAIVELIVLNNIKVVDGVKKNDSISQYISFITAMLTAHTNLEFSEDPVADYDILSESGLLTPIIDTFKTDYSECDVLLKMALANELEDNNVNIVFGKFLNSILYRLDVIGEYIKSSVDGVDINSILGESFNQEDLAKLSSFLDNIISNFFWRSWFVWRKLK